MNGFPPPPGQGYQPPPAGSSFPPPPNMQQAQGQQNRGFPPPPGQASQQQRQFPPPPAAASVNQMSTQMGQMSLSGRTLPPPAPAAASKPAMFAPPPAPGMMAPPTSQPPAPSMMAPPPAPAMMQPPRAPGMMAPPPAPAMMTPSQPPAPTMMGVPPAPAMSQPPAPSMMAPSQPQPPGPPGAPQAVGGSAFYGQQPAPGQMQRAMNPGQPAPPGAMPGQPGGFEAQVDYSIEIPERLCRFSSTKLPQTPNMAAACKVPIGGILRPLAPAETEEDDVDVVQPGNAGIIRCKRCRTYINPFVAWVENGRRWRCNICAQLNECPSNYFCHLDETGQRRDKDQRPELSKGVVEFIAPAEYMVRPPQEPTYFFVIDVGAMAVRSGMLESAATAIRDSLDDLPGRGRTKIGFITYDNSVHYYNLASDLSAPQMVVVSDLKELFVPLPDSLLVNLQESRAVVESFLDNLPTMFSRNPVASMSCLGPALKAAFTVMKQIGGKMCVFQSMMPNLGDGALRPRENPAMMGTPNETKLLRPDMTWYKDTAVEFSRQQISVDMFLFPYQYVDIAALSELPRYTAGQLYSYPGFNPERDGPTFEAQLNKRLTQSTAFEAVMRIRCTKGMRITNFYGNFFIRGTDLLALPNCNSDSIFGFDLAHDEQNPPSPFITVQAALLFTSSDGQRRIRVMTQALQITSLTSELFESVDTEAACALLAKQALDVSMKTSVDNARMRLQQTCVDMCRAAKGGDKRSVSGYAVPPPNAPGGGNENEQAIPENLDLLPLYTLALMKNVAFRGGTDVHPDERVHSQYILNSAGVEETVSFIYPKMFSIHDMDSEAGLQAADNVDDEVQTAGRNRILLPQAVNLSVDRLSSNGIFLLDTGVQMHLWVGRSCDPSIMVSLFGVESLENADMNQVSLQQSGDDFINRFASITNALRESVADPFVVTPKINIIREGDGFMESRFFWHLVEDRASFQGGTYSYGEFMNFVNNPNQGAPPAPGPRAPPGGPGAPRGPPGGMGGLPPSQMGGMGGPPPPQMGGMGRPQMGGPPPPPQMGGMRSAAPPQMGGMAGPPRTQMGGGMGGPPTQMAPPPTQMVGAPASASGAPPTMRGPPTQMAATSSAPPPPGPPPMSSMSQSRMPPPPGGMAPPSSQGSYRSPAPASYGAPPPAPASGYGAPPPPRAQTSYGARAPPPPQGSYGGTSSQYGMPPPPPPPQYK